MCIRLRKIIIQSLFLGMTLFDLLWWHKWYPAFLGTLYFTYDYISYRVNAIMDFKASKRLRENITLKDIKKIENDYTQLDAFSSPEKRAMNRSPLDRYFYYDRYKQAEKRLNKYAEKSKRILDLGCGFGLNALYACRNLRGSVIGLDLDYLKLIKANKKAVGDPSCKNIAFVAGDACSMPFKDTSFDCILMTEAIEHLIHPERGIAACHDLLCDGGILILTTPSSHNLNYTCNPMIVLEKILSLIWDAFLPCYHSLHARFEYDRKNPESQYGIHYHFSIQKMWELLNRNGFRTMEKGSFEIEIAIFPIISLLFHGNLKMISHFVGPVEAVVHKLPVLKYLGQHIIWVAQKTGDLPATQDNPKTPDRLN
jgi:ubiquinone/menaquinone biosynthesis C-methylase UbiE